MKLRRWLLIAASALFLSACAAGSASVTSVECKVSGTAVGQAQVCAYRPGETDPCACVKGGAGSEPFWTTVGAALGGAAGWLMKVWR